MEQSQQQLAITIKKSPEHNSQGALMQKRQLCIHDEWRSNTNRQIQQWSRNTI